MNLTQEPEVVTWPETHYVFVEKNRAVHGNGGTGLANRAFFYACAI